MWRSKSLGLIPATGRGRPTPRKRSLGQNFLRDEKVLADIVGAAQLSSADFVLEVGPGEGILTRALLDTGAQVVAVEKDIRLVEYLKTRFAKEIKSGQLKLVADDALKMQSVKIKNQNDNLKFKIVSNIPYYITGKFLRKFLSAENKPMLVVLMLQKEVALRIIGSDAKRPERSRGTRESILSLSVKAYGQPKILRYVPKENFEPVPKVDSAILLIENISDKFFVENKIGEKNFFALVKIAFASPRKTLLNNLSSCYKKEKINTAFEIAGIEKNSRAENVGLEKWSDILRELAL